MNNTVVIVGLIFVAMLILIPLVMVGRFVARIALGYFESRRAETHKIMRVLPGLGDFSTYDDKHWHGEVEGLQFSLVSLGQTPTDLQSHQVRTILESISPLVEEAKRYLAADENISRLPGGSKALEPYGFEIQDVSDFVFELTHPSDEDGIYRIEFKDGKPIASGRDD